MIASGAVGDLLAITARLIACIEREIALLRAMRPHDMQALQIDKAGLADAYEAHLRAMRQGDGPEAAISEQLRHELTEATERLQTVLAENARALRAVKDVNERVLKAIVEAADEERGRPVGYTGSGAAPGGRAAAPVSLAVNQRY